MAILLVENGPRPGTRLAFLTSAVVGRVQPADLVLDHPTVSRRHAMLRRGATECSVADLGSINGTFVNGRRIAKPTRVHDGDLLQFGAVRVRFVDDTPQAAAYDGQGLDAIADEPDRTYERQLALPAVPTSLSPPAAVGGTSAADADELATRLAVLDAVARQSCKVADQQALVAYVAERIFDLLPQAERIVILLKAPDGSGMVPVVGRARDGSLGHTRMSRTLLDDVLTRREGVLVTDVPTASVGCSTSIDMMQIRSLLCVPILFDDEVYGVVHADTTSFARRFSRHDLTLLLALASQLGMAFAYARLHAEAVRRQANEHDMEFARRLQRHFLPQQLPHVPNYEIAVHLGVAEQLGGDLYDVLAVDTETCGVVVGDVCGKGVPAALYAAKLGADMRYLAAGHRSPAVAMDRLNRAFAQYDHEGMFVTVALATLGLTSHQLTLANAGHPQPILRTRGGACSRVGPTGDVPLGVDEHGTFSERVMTLAPGDALVFYTDGITEAMNAAADLYGDERLMATLSSVAGSASDLVAAVLTDVQRFSTGVPQADDQTILCLRRLG